MLEVVTLTALQAGRGEVLDHMERAILAGEEGSLLYLCATRPLLEDTRRRLLSRPQVSGLGRLRLVLFQGLVELILRQNMEAVPPLSPAARDLLLAQVIRRLAADGRLANLKPIAETRGLGRSVAGLLAELKRANVRPTLWRQAAEARKQPRELDLAVIYETYQTGLERMQAVDPDDLGLWALDALVRTGGAFFLGDPTSGQPPIRHVLVDGYQDFTPVQLAWLKVATALVPRVTVYLEYDPDRPELYAPSERTMAALEELGGGGLPVRAAAATGADRPGTDTPQGEEHEAQASEGAAQSGAAGSFGCGAAVLRLLAEELFRPPRPGKATGMEAAPAGAAEASAAASGAASSAARAPGAAVEVLAAQGDAQEARELARWVRQALLADPSLSPADVAVVYREIGPEAELLARELEQAGVPSSFRRTMPTARVPAVRAALRLLRAAAAPESIDNLIAAATCGYVNLPGLDGFEEAARELGPAVPAREWLRRLEARVAYLRQELARLRREAGGAAADGADDPPSTDGEAAAWRLARDVRRYEAARRTAGELLQRLGRWPAVLSPEDAEQLTMQLLASCGVREAALSALRPGVEPDEAAGLAARDLAGLDRLLEAARDVRQAFEASETPGLTPAEWAEALEQALAVQELGLPAQAPRGRAGVQILPAPAVRRLRFRLVAVAGLVEGRFPKHFQPDWLLPDEARESLRRHGVHLDTRRELAALERLYFYQAVTCAGERLLLSYPAAAEDGREQLASPYLQEVLALLPAGSVPVRGPRPGQLWPDGWQEAATPEELRQMAVFRALGRRDGGAATLLARLQQGGLLPDSLWPRLAAQAERESPLWGVHDGRITRAETQAALAQRYPRDYAFSASQLGRYGTCPFSYFAERVLRLAPLDEGGEEVDALQVGSLYHQILYTFWAHHRGEAMDPSRREEYREELAQTAEVELAAFEAQGLAAHPGLWAAKRRQIKERLLALLDWELGLAREGGLTPLLLEVGFGMPGLDPASRPEPVWVGGSESGFLLRGKIDRIDRTGDGGFIVLDYKAGAPPRGKDIETGRDLQVPLYLRVAEALLEPGSRPLGGGYQSIKERSRNQGLWKKAWSDVVGVSARAGGALEDVEWEARVAASVAYAEAFVAGIRRGDFRLDPNGECPKSCPYQRICRVDDHRLARKRRQAEFDGGQPDGGAGDKGAGSQPEA